MSGMSDFFNRTRLGQQKIAMVSLFTAAMMAHLDLYRHMSAVPVRDWRLWVLPLLCSSSLSHTSFVRSVVPMRRITSGQCSFHSLPASSPQRRYTFICSDMRADLVPVHFFSLSLVGLFRVQSGFLQFDQPPSSSLIEA
jgi:hypothetical protein